LGAWSESEKNRAEKFWQGLVRGTAWFVLRVGPSRGTQSIWGLKSIKSNRMEILDRKGSEINQMKSNGDLGKKSDGKIWSKVDLVRLGRLSTWLN
jgi:hypothetical protein